MLINIDPRSGSYLVKALIAATLGYDFYFEDSWFYIKAIFGKNKKAPETEQL